MSIEDVDEYAALHFEGSVTVGTLFDDNVTENAASYFAGVVARKVDKFHFIKKKKGLANCDTCSNILEAQNLDYHTFTSFKEYVSKDSLFYPSKPFINNIITFERIILYFLDNHISKFGFVTCLKKMMEKHLVPGFFCCKEVEIFCIKFVVKCRSFHAEKRLNDRFKATDYSDKIRKITNK